MKTIKNFLKRQTNGTSLVVLAAKMEDSEVIKLAAKQDKLYGQGSIQGKRLRAYVEGRKNHFQPANW